MRKVIQISYGEPGSLAYHLGSGVQGWLFGSVAKGTSTEESDLDIYVTGYAALKTEERLMFKRPKVIYNGKVYKLHVTGPITVAPQVFFQACPEARKIYAL